MQPAEPHSLHLLRAGLRRQFSAAEWCTCAAAIEQTITAVGASFAQFSEVPAPFGPFPFPQLSSAQGVAGGWLDGEFYNLIQFDKEWNGTGGACDGVVAAEHDSFTYQDLIANTSEYLFAQNTQHKGGYSPSGCGPKDSDYAVHRQIANLVQVVPDVLGRSLQAAELTIVHAGLSWSLASGSKAGFVIQQGPAPGTLENAGALVTVTLDNNR